MTAQEIYELRDEAETRLRPGCNEHFIPLHSVIQLAPGRTREELLDALCQRHAEPEG